MIVRYDSYKNRIIFPERIATGILPSFAGALYQWKSRNLTNRITLDFSGVTKAFANGMLGIIATVADLRLQGYEITIQPPGLPVTKAFFLSTNWGYLLDPFLLPKSSRRNQKHFVQQFTSFQELPNLVNNFMDIIMRHIEMPKDILSALEWSVNEICDNVINHSISKPGGFLQVIAYPQNNIIAFTVADAGRGILSSLKEGFPDLNNDMQAIEEAIKVGVTRNKEYGQGNGLAGTLRITTMTGGSLDIISGGGRLLLTSDSITPSSSAEENRVGGTYVSGQIHISPNFSIANALTFGAIPYTSYNIVDAKYELENEDALLVLLVEEAPGTGTRAAGKEMRIKVLNLISAKPGYHIILDWQNVSVISSSFADEFLGKLFLKLGKSTFEQVIKNANMEPLVSQLIEKAITERAITPDSST